MAQGDRLTWGVSSATVGIGETITVSIASGMAPTASGITGAFNGLATAAVGGSEVEITGVSAGTVTVPVGTDVGNLVKTANAFTLTVTAPADDQNFLNERGLARFWGNIDDIKQNKLTAGAGISITNDVISATGGGVADSVAWGHITGSMSSQTDLTTALAAKANSADLATVATSGDYDDLSDKPTIPTVNDATLTIQQNGASLGTFTANASSNATIDVNAPKLTSLVGSVQTSDYHRSVVALCEVASGSGSTVNSWSSGKLVAHRNNGAYGVAEIGINIEAKRSTAYYSNVSYFSNIALLSPTANINTGLGFRPCTFKYNNVYYAGIEFYISSSSASNVYFSGVGNFDVFGLDYYSVSHGSTASSVLNSEVYNSLNYTQWNEERNQWHVGRATRDIIYNNGSGTNANFSTTTAMSNYDEVEISYRDGNQNYAFKRIPGPAGSFVLDVVHPGANSVAFWYISRYLVSGTNITVGANNMRKAIGASSITTTAAQDIYITRIVGIRH